MPAGSNRKRERQYEHIKESYEARGQKGRAKEIAARTVNKQRAEHGEAGRASARSSGRSSSGERTRDQLYEEARRRGIEGRSSMNKAQLQRALAR